MRQEHLAGEKCFVDYAGQTVPVTDRHTGEIQQAQITHWLLRRVGRRLTVADIVGSW